MAYGHHHHHDHDDVPGVRELDAPAVRLLLGGVVALLVVAALVGIGVWWPRGDPAVAREVLGYGGRVDATATAAEAGPCSFDPESECNDVVLNDAGADVDAAARYSFADVQRREPLVILAVVFGVAVVALGRLRGLLALAGIGVTAGVLLAYVFPALLQAPRRWVWPSPVPWSSRSVPSTWHTASATAPRWHW